MAETPATDTGAASPLPRAASTPKPSSSKTRTRPARSGDQRTRQRPAAETREVTGTVRIHPRGFGFADLDEVVVVGEEQLDSCFIPPQMLAGQLDGDAVSLEVAVEQSPTGARLTAAKLERTGRTRSLLFGIVSESGTEIAVDGWCANTPWKLDSNAAAGEAVLAEITSGDTAAVLASFADPQGSEALRVRTLARRELSPELPSEVIAGGEEISRTMTQRIGGELGARRDLRGLTTITIDAESSRDLDDALSVYPADAEGGVRVLVHIADVAEAVAHDSLVDTHAREVGTSVYLPGWSKPMLPRVLSEEALSLLPGEERFALTCEMRLDTEGEVTSIDIYESLISSNERLSYDLVAEVLAGRPTGVAPELVESLRWLRTAASRLTQARTRRGGVEANRLEAELTVSLSGEQAEQVTGSAHNDAHELIERLMVAANESVARWLYERGLPGLYRCHVGPKPTASAELEAFCAELGVYPGLGASLTPASLAALSTQIEGLAGENSTVWQVLRGHLGRASYTPHNTGHFGLGSERYLHFTSPIRRYADLVVHRVVKSYLAGTRTGSEIPHAGELAELGARLDAAASSASRAEADARKAGWCAILERERIAHPRKKLSARVTRVGATGIHVTLAGSLVQSKVSLKELGGREWKVEGFSLVSPTTTYTLGQTLEVTLRSADPATGLIELALPGLKHSSSGPRKGARR